MEFPSFILILFIIIMCVEVLFASAPITLIGTAVFFTFILWLNDRDDNEGDPA